MDTALKDGDFKLNARGYPVKIEAYDEILQRVLIRLLCKKGSFTYDRSLGSELYKLKYPQYANSDIEKYALKYAKEALEDMTNVSISSVLIENELENEQIGLTFLLSVNGETKELSIEI